MEISLYAKEIVAVATSLATLVAKFFPRSSQADLSFSDRHNYTFVITNIEVDDAGAPIEKMYAIHTRSMFILNSGRGTLTNVELVLNWQPKCVNIWPSRYHEPRVVSDKRFSILFPSLAPGERVSVDILDIDRELPFVIAARSDQAVARNVNLVWVPEQKQKRLWLRTALMVLGAAAAVYLAISLIQYLVLRTPIG